MTAVPSSISEENSTLQFKGTMVLALFVMIGIMVFDRSLYACWSFTTIKATAKILNTDAPLITNDNSSDGKSQFSAEKIDKR